MYEDLSGRGTTRAENAQGTPTQSHISPDILVYEDYLYQYTKITQYTTTRRLHVLVHEDYLV